MKSSRVIKPQKPDSLINSHMVQDIKRSRIQSLLWEYDRAIVEAEATWGTDRLPYIVGEDLRLKWWRNVDALNQAVTQNDVDAVAVAVPRMIKGIARLIEEAQAAGHKPLKPDVWETPMGDKILRIVRAYPEHSDQVDKRPGVVTYSLEEIARIADHHSHALVNKIKETWPGATVQQVRTITQEMLDDEIPF